MDPPDFANADQEKALVEEGKRSSMTKEDRCTCPALDLRVNICKADLKTFRSKTFVELKNSLKAREFIHGYSLISTLEAIWFSLISNDTPWSRDFRTTSIILVSTISMTLSGRKLAMYPIHC
jgi:hypothetical protein